MKRFLYLPVNGDFQEVIVEGTLADSKRLVGGYIECLRVTEEIDLWLNEEGKLDDLEPNFGLVRGDQILDIIVGDVFFASHDSEGETISITEEQIAHVKERFIERRLFKY